MPITRAEFERGDFKQRAGADESYVLNFLKENSNYAYEPDELAEIFKRNPSTIRQHLKKLLDQGLIERKSPKYILSKKVLNSIKSKKNSKVRLPNNKKAKKKGRTSKTKK